MDAMILQKNAQEIPTIGTKPQLRCAWCEQPKYALFDVEIANASDCATYEAICQECVAPKLLAALLEEE